jgi:HSP20 family molecular chaperone IbpA
MSRTTYTVGDFFGNLPMFDSSGCWTTTGTRITVGDNVYQPIRYDDPPIKKSIADELSDLVNRVGTPWDNVNSFPPFNVHLHNTDGSVRFQFALAGIDRDTVSVEFNDQKIWLIIKEQPETDEAWTPVKQKIRSSVEGKYYYSMDLEKFDYHKAEAKWDNGILEVVIPVNEDRKPFRLAIKN